jgi:hypothetical protein
MPSPKIKTCIVCEDVRFELRSLASLMGVYGAAPDVGIFVTKFGEPARICFVFMGSPSPGKFVFEPELRGRLGKVPATPLPPRLEVSLAMAGGSVFAAFWFPNVVFPGPDRYTIALRIDGIECFSSTFDVLPTQERIPSLG